MWTDPGVHAQMIAEEKAAPHGAGLLSPKEEGQAAPAPHGRTPKTSQCGRDSSHGERRRRRGPGLGAEQEGLVLDGDRVLVRDHEDVLEMDGGGFPPPGRHTHSGTVKKIHFMRNVSYYNLLNVCFTLPVFHQPSLFVCALRRAHLPKTRESSFTPFQLPTSRKQAPSTPPATTTQCQPACLRGRHGDPAHPPVYAGQHWSPA